MQGALIVILGILASIVTAASKLGWFTRNEKTNDRGLDAFTKLLNDFMAKVQACELRIEQHTKCIERMEKERGVHDAEAQLDKAKLASLGERLSKVEGRMNGSI